MVRRIARESGAFFVDVDGSAHSRAVDEETPSDSLAEGQVSADDQLLDVAVLRGDRHGGDLEGAPHGRAMSSTLALTP